MMKSSQLRKALVSIVGLLALVTAAQATLTYSVTGVAVTPGGTYVPPPPPGSISYALTVSENSGMWPVGISILIGDGVTPINQVNPSGVSTIFADEPPWIILPAGAFLDWDSHFPYRANPGPAQQVIAGLGCSESGVSLNGDWALFGGTAAPNVTAGPTLLVANVTLGPGASVPFTATVCEYDPALNAWAATLNISGTIPEPATIALLALGGFALIRRRRK